MNHFKIKSWSITDRLSRGLFWLEVKQPNCKRQVNTLLFGELKANTE